MTKGIKFITRDFSLSLSPPPPHEKFVATAYKNKFQATKWRRVVNEKRGLFLGTPEPDCVTALFTISEGHI